MAWPQKPPDIRGNETTVGLATPTGMIHGDVHGGNFMFGSVLNHQEHEISPVLHLIDFGQSELWGATVEHSTGATAEQYNVLDMGIMMATVITMNTDSKYGAADIEVDLSKLGRPIDTLCPAAGILPDPEARPIIDPCPHVDPDLRLVVAACMADEPQNRPTLAELENWVFSEVCNTYPAHYFRNPGGADYENDSTIQKMVQMCIFNAESGGDFFPRAVL
ncbi:uncharacterized protein JN550_003298 [Neoarthrinium moseri]|uniref:uncharacterized protein n=1 Tax=Neoarthrinium moseri TaxID=1658444 RepID=UPI001FDD2DB4|nr:uncharacterized protein JN550_003298 [Neoarthrinium moseri]KAI1873045.1 hypothetical protein JN550_003298 [Neoarthrinium moseri]